MRKFLMLAAMVGGLTLFGMAGTANAHDGCGPYYGGGYYGGGYYGGFGYGGPGVRVDIGYGGPGFYYGRPIRRGRYYRGDYRDRYYGRRGYGRYRWRY